MKYSILFIRVVFTICTNLRIFYLSFFHLFHQFNFIHCKPCKEKTPEERYIELNNISLYRITWSECMSVTRRRLNERFTITTSNTSSSPSSLPLCGIYRTVTEIWRKSHSLLLSRFAPFFQLFILGIEKTSHRSIWNFCLQKRWKNTEMWNIFYIQWKYPCLMDGTWDFSAMHQWFCQGVE